LERIRFGKIELKEKMNLKDLIKFILSLKIDKILFITEKLYCVVDGCLMHVYKKPTDKRQSKSYKLTGKNS
jgi:hypothetical protein